MKKIRQTTPWIVAMALCLVSMAGCPLLRDPFQVVYPEGSQDWNTSNGKIAMTVRFNHNVDMSSLEAGVNVIFNSDKVTNAAINITPGVSNNEIIIITEDDWMDLLTSSGVFTLTLKGDGASPVRNENGLPLDGNMNGEIGGDFVHTYWLVT